MRRVLLVLLLVPLALFTVTPLLAWTAGRYGSSLPLVEESWTTWLELWTLTVPVGLALMAIVLAIHGVMINRVVAEDAVGMLAEEAAAARAAMVPAGVAAAGGAVAGAAVVGGAAAASRTSQSASPPPAEEPAGKDKKKPKKPGAAAKASKKATRRVKSRGKGIARREMRKAVPRF